MPPDPRMPPDPPEGHKINSRLLMQSGSLFKPAGYFNYYETPAAHYHYPRYQEIITISTVHEFIMRLFLCVTRIGLLS